MIIFCLLISLNVFAQSQCQNLFVSPHNDLQIRNAVLFLDALTKSEHTAFRNASGKLIFLNTIGEKSNTSTEALAQALENIASGQHVEIANHSQKILEDKSPQISVETDQSKLSLLDRVFPGKGIVYRNLTGAQEVKYSLAWFALSLGTGILEKHLGGDLDPLTSYSIVFSLMNFMVVKTALTIKYVLLPTLQMTKNSGASEIKSLTAPLFFQKLIKQSAQTNAPLILIVDQHDEATVRTLLDGAEFLPTPFDFDSWKFQRVN